MKKILGVVAAALFGVTLGFACGGASSPATGSTTPAKGTESTVGGNAYGAAAYGGAAYGASKTGAETGGEADDANGW